MFWLAAAADASSYAVMFAAHGLLPVIASLTLGGLAPMILSIGVWSFRQETTPPELMGRVTGLTGSIFKLGMPFAIFGSGLLTVLVGVRAIFLLGAVVNLLVSHYYLVSPLRRVVGDVAQERSSLHLCAFQARPSWRGGWVSGERARRHSFPSEEL